MILSADLMVSRSLILLCLVFDLNQTMIDTQNRLYDGREIVVPRNLKVHIRHCVAENAEGDFVH